MPIELESAPIAEAIIVNELANGAKATNHAHTSNCANCGAIAERKYCPECGQSTHIHHSLLHLVEELLHGLFHFDTKAWRTLPALIMHPGELTRQYVDGQRTRFVSPLALFLFLIFLMFFVFGLTSNSSLESSISHQISQDFNQSVQKQRQQIEEDERRLAQLSKEAPDRAMIEKKIVDGKAELLNFEKLLSNEAQKNTSSLQPRTQNTPESVRKNFENNMPILATPMVVNGVTHAIQNPELALYKFKNTVAKLAFLLVPISLPFLWLLFAFRRKFSMFEHAVFSLYSLSFMTILMMLCAILIAMNWYGLAIILLMSVPPIHMFRQLRGAYRLGIFASAWRTIALLFVALLSLLIFAVIALRVSM